MAHWVVHEIALSYIEHGKDINCLIKGIKRHRVDGPVGESYHHAVNSVEECLHHHRSNNAKPTRKQETLYTCCQPNIRRANHKYSTEKGCNAWHRRGKLSIDIVGPRDPLVGAQPTHCCIQDPSGNPKSAFSSSESRACAGIIKPSTESNPEWV
jgi:hypothetical protein